MTEKIEGDVGTWSHCGNRTPHAPHRHDIIMNEGRYSNIQCNGTRDRAADDAVLLANVLRKFWADGSLAYVELDHVANFTFTVDGHIDLTPDEREALVRAGVAPCRRCHDA